MSHEVLSAGNGRAAPPEQGPSGQGRGPAGASPAVKARVGMDEAWALSAPRHGDVADNVVVIGAGPAGLTAAFELGRLGKTCTVLEADDVVGGISRTVERDGWRFDIGGHRFFTKVKVVEDLWHQILPGDELMVRPRLSRIYYQGKYYDYPLKPFNALRNLGFVESVRCAGSYAWARVRPPKDQTTFEGWVAARFGWRLYDHFFKTYTEKVWGYPGSQLQADWAAQRIKNLNLFNAVRSALFPKKGQRSITTLIDQFEYPRLGPGMMWERCRDMVEGAGSKVFMGAPVTRIRHGNGQAFAVCSGTDGVVTEHPASAVVSSMPLSALIKAMDPAAPSEVQAAAAALHYRDHVTVALVVPESASFPDNWVYVHDPSVKMGRIQNFGRWSPDMVKDGRTCLGLEYFVFEGDEVWSLADEELVEMGKREIGILGLVDPCAVEAGYAVRVPKAYPYYDADYRQNVEIVRAWLEDNVANVHPVGRNGMHRYNNQDHSMYTAMLSVENIMGAHHDVWSVNVEEEYHEELRPGTKGRGAAGTAAVDGAGRSAPVLPKRAVPAQTAPARTAPAQTAPAPTVLERTALEQVVLDDQVVLPDDAAVPNVFPAVENGCSAVTGAVRQPGNGPGGSSR